MTIVIPVWLLWTLGVVLGVPLLLALIFFAVLGFGFAWSFWRKDSW